MARFITYDHPFSDNEYTVSKDDLSRSRNFTNYKEAMAYYEFLQAEEAQDSIAKNQAIAVDQNKEIIANQRRMIEAQEKNNRMPTQPSFSAIPKPVFDPEYAEWLQFKKETDPAYIKWKKEKEARAAEVRAYTAKDNTKKRVPVDDRLTRELERIRQRREREDQLEKLYHQNEVQRYKDSLDKYRDAIETYEKWCPIVEELSSFGVDPIRDVITNSTDCTQFGAQDFLRFRSIGYPGLNEMKRIYEEMQKAKNDGNFSSEDEEYIFWKYKYKNLITHHKEMQKGLGKSTVSGLKPFLGRFIGNLCDAKNYRKWGFFGISGDIRRKYKAYWEKYQHIYPIIEPYISSWKKDIDIMYIEEYHDDED